MKNVGLLLLLISSSFFISCSSDHPTSSQESADGLEIIKVDLSEAREGKLSEFFEDEIEYIWLQENAEEGLIGREVPHMFFHEDKIYVMEVYGCECIQIFDRTGKFLNKIQGNGEGPGQYLEFSDAIVRNGELMLVSTNPIKLMWFGLDGKFLREQKAREQFGAVVYSDRENRYYFYTRASTQGEFFLESVNDSFEDTVRSIPFDSELFYGSYFNRGNLKLFHDKVYLGMPFQDTIYSAKEGTFVPELVFDFGRYGQSHEEMKKMQETLIPPLFLDFLSNRTKLYFGPGWFITASQLYSRLKYEKEDYDLFYTRKDHTSHVVKGGLINDIDESFDPFSFSHHFYGDKVGFYIPGKTLYDLLLKKKESLGQEGFDEYINGKGKNFAQAAMAAKDSENPVLIVYTVKK